MRTFQRYLWLTALMVAVAWAAIPAWFGISFPRTPGPEFDTQVRRYYVNLINQEKPNLVIMGDSTMRYGVDPDLLAERTGKKVLSIDVPGSASAYWYLVVKNNIVLARHHPQAVIIVFRETMLTAPGYRVQGGYLVRMDEYAASQEPILLERAYLDQMGIVEKWAQGYIPLYGARGHVRKEVESWIRYTIPGRLFDCDQDCVEGHISKVFTTQNLEPGQLRDAVASAEQYLYTPARTDFAGQVDRSFLPEIIRLTREQGIQLVVIRMKSETKGKGNSDPAGIRQYISDLTEYLEANGVIFLDYGRDPRFTHEYFKDPIHLNSKGELLFTQVIADGITDALK